MLSSHKTLTVINFFFFAICIRMQSSASIKALTHSFSSKTFKNPCNKSFKRSSQHYSFQSSSSQHKIFSISQCNESSRRFRGNWSVDPQNSTPPALLRSWTCASMAQWPISCSNSLLTRSWRMSWKVSQFRRVKRFGTFWKYEKHVLQPLHFSIRLDERLNRLSHCYGCVMHCFEGFLRHTIRCFVEEFWFFCHLHSHLMNAPP